MLNSPPPVKWTAKMTNMLHIKFVFREVRGDTYAATEISSIKNCSHHSGRIIICDISRFIISKFTGSILEGYRATQAGQQSGRTQRENVFAHGTTKCIIFLTCQLI